MTELSKSVGLVSDGEAGQDLLAFAPYTETLVDIIRDANTQGPLVIGILGSWGSGKTSLMRFVERALHAISPERLPFRVVWFDALKYEKEEALWRAMLLRVLDELRDRDAQGADITPTERRQAIERLEQRLAQELAWEDKGTVTVDWGAPGKTPNAGVRFSFAFLPGFAAKAVQAAQAGDGGQSDAENLLSAFQREVIQHRQAQLRSIQEFQQEFGALVENYIAAQGERLVVFVDDLDRCLPPKAIQVLETIKLFLDVPGCLFVLALDPEVIARGIEVKSRAFLAREVLASAPDEERSLPIDGRRYLDKIIQLPFRLPRIKPREIQAFVNGLVALPDLRCAEVFAQGIETNPRRIKRALNVFLFISRLAEKRGVLLQPVRLAKVVVVYDNHPVLFERLRQNPALLRDIEHYLRAEVAAQNRQAEHPDLSVQGQGDSVDDDAHTPTPPIDPTLLTPALKKLLTLYLDAPEATFGDVPYPELSAYLHLTHATLPETPPPPEHLPHAAYFSIPTLVYVPAGQFPMGTSDEDVTRLLNQPATAPAAAEFQAAGGFAAEQPQHVVALDEYEIARYPVTNAEYQVFVRATKHRAPLHWSGNSFPEEIAAQPVIFVSYDDCKTYCEWLTDVLRREEILSEDELIRLPSEAEWEKAASWDPEALGAPQMAAFAAGNSSTGETTKRLFPWGDEWDAHRCNSHETENEGTTPVGQFSPAGDSALGAADMAGNVAEWCTDWYHPAYYNNSPEKNPTGVPSGQLRIVRGGSFRERLMLVRGAARRARPPKALAGDTGFRCVRAKLTPAQKSRFSM